MNHLRLIDALNIFLQNIIKNKESTFRVRKNLELILDGFKFDLNPTHYENKTFQSFDDFLFFISATLKHCFEMYDGFDYIHKKSLNNYLESIGNLYNLNIKNLVERVIYLDNDNDRTIISYLEKYDKDLKLLIRNTRLFENKINKEIFSIEDENLFLNNIQSFYYPSSESYVNKFNGENIKTEPIEAPPQQNIKLEPVEQQLFNNKENVDSETKPRRKRIHTSEEEAKEKNIDAGKEEKEDNKQTIDKKRKKTSLREGGEEEEEEERERERMKDDDDDTIMTEDRAVIKANKKRHHNETQDNDGHPYHRDDKSNNRGKKKK